MKAKTQDLTGTQLDYAVAVADGWSEFTRDEHLLLMGKWRGRSDSLNIATYQPSIDWANAGPIIEQGCISIAAPSLMREQWRAMIDSESQHAWIIGDGPTPLIAAMRCFVTSKLGDDVEIPEELK